MGFLLMLAASCVTDDENLPDYASKIVGTYNGTVKVTGIQTVPGSSTLTKSSEKEVDLEIIIGSSSIPLDGIDVSSSGGDIYNLRLTDSSGSLTGKVEGNRLTYTLTDGNDTVIFDGTK